MISEDFGNSASKIHKKMRVLHTIFREPVYYGIYLKYVVCLTETNNRFLMLYVV